MRWVVPLLILIVLVSGCVSDVDNARFESSSSSSTQETTPNAGNSEWKNPVVGGMNSFAIELYKKLGENNGNVFFSPYSIETALTIAYEGARGATRDEMGNVLQLPGDNETRWKGFRGLILSLESNESSPFVLRSANALWVQSGYPVREDYLRIAKEYYLANASDLDFQGNPEGAADVINDWVKNRTGGRIRDIISRLSPDTRLVITNAVYFKANWSSRFEAVNTKNETFYSPSGPVVVQMMHQTAKFLYFENDDLQAVELPYEGNRLGMLVILPREGRFEEVERQLNAEMISEIVANMTDEMVAVSIPKFKLEEDYHLKEVLMEMGVKRAFTRPDFAGISELEDLVISDVIHKTYISVAEKGTEAAAATAVIMTLAAPPENNLKVFRADRPFIFFIHDRETGAILFMGRLMNPKE
ncbi:serpin family protein [Thermococcus gammatolerans]|uniref:Serine protease inhibitor, serpin n=1 Tax=Thermococcus gammatolerans (strain DSM 15229 / JCM 11827 / EJ3) TaxID=593117 RepID=C5A4E9_THEGJ|nr:serpin family protein [Thermococcus gammatolerans]ACS33111.1 Serine protease inhibitor, serpin [Thermococcus gammatolerans EJ3]